MDDRMLYKRGKEGRHIFLSILDKDIVGIVGIVGKVWCIVPYAEYFYAAYLGAISLTQGI